jgi:hypothetical protein
MAADVGGPTAVGAPTENMGAPTDNGKAKWEVPPVMATDMGSPTALGAPTVLVPPTDTMGTPIAIGEAPLAHVGCPM